jgi:hypothetical protein
MVMVILIVWPVANLWYIVIIFKESPEKYDNVVLWKVKCLCLDIGDWGNKKGITNFLGLRVLVAELLQSDEKTP